MHVLPGASAAAARRTARALSLHRLGAAGVHVPPMRSCVGSPRACRPASRVTPRSRGRRPRDRRALPGSAPRQPALPRKPSSAMKLNIANPAAGTMKVRANGAQGVPRGGQGRRPMRAAASPACGAAPNAAPVPDPAPAVAAVPPRTVQSRLCGAPKGCAAAACCLALFMGRERGRRRAGGAAGSWPQSAVAAAARCRPRARQPRTRRGQRAVRRDFMAVFRPCVRASARGCP